MAGDRRVLAEAQCEYIVEKFGDAPAVVGEAENILAQIRREEAEE